MKGFEFQFEVEQRFLMGMTGGFRTGAITFNKNEQDFRKTTPLFALGPLVSEKVIGREIRNFRERKMDQTPSSDGASIVNRTLCNDDSVNNRSIDVSYTRAIVEEEVNTVTKRDFTSYEWEKSLTVTVEASYNPP
jgi:hypothetical protein